MEAKTSDRDQTDLILVNGRVFTTDPSQPYAEAVAIRGERVLAVGTSGEIAALAKSNTRRIDLQGHVTIPGINDAHAHFPSVDLGGHHLSFQSMEPSWQETQDALAEAVRAAPAGTWIFGVVGGTVLEEPTANRFALDRVAPDHPVSLIAFSGHGNIVNTKALTALEVAEEEPDPMGGYFERVPGSQRINGRIFEYAQWSFWRGMASRIPNADFIRDMQSLADEAVRYGVTSIQNMPFMSTAHCVKLLQEAQMPSACA
jgi:predicted amidohydrolase YtcJ